MGKKLKKSIDLFCGCGVGGVSEKQNNIPDNWINTTLSDILVDPKNNIVDGPFGSNLKASEYQDKGIPILRIQNIERLKFFPKNIKFVTKEKAVQLQRHSYICGDIVVTKLGIPLGKACIIPQNFKDGIIVADLVRIRLDNANIYKKWLCYAINSNDIANQLKLLTKGTTRPRVNLTHIRGLSVNLPPLNEQKRIVAKIEELFSELDKGIENLKTDREQLKVYRQSLLKNAFEGKLTEKWREENNFSNVWKHIPLKQVIEEPKYGTSKKCYYDCNGIGVLRIPNIVSGFVDSSDLKSAQFDDSEINKYSLRSGDILTIRSNGSVSIVGKSALIRKQDEKYLYAGYLIRLRPKRTEILPEFLYNSLSSHTLRTQIEEKAKSTSGVNNINAVELKSLIIPICSLQEQQKIVEEIESKFSVIDQIEQDIEANLQKSESLRQSILKKAFSGELVEQDPSDEPASVLLDRIRIDINWANSTIGEIANYINGRAFKPSEWEVCGLPKNWILTELKELGDIVSGGTPSTKEPSYWGNEVNWISPSDLTGYTNKTISKGKKNITLKGLQNSSAKIMPAGSIHFSSRAPIGYVVISSEPMSTNQGFKSLIPSDDIYCDYVYYYLKSAKQLAEKVATGTTFKEISGTVFGKLPFPLPPTNEQKRIVAKIEELFSELDKGIENLKTAREQLKVYRQSVLKNAFEGKLTEKWREQNQDKIVSLDTILNKIPDKRIKKLNCISPDETTKLPKLPNGWKYVRLGCFIDNISAGKSFKCDEREPNKNEVGVAKVSAVTWGEYDESQSKTCLDPEKINPDYFIKPNDFLFSRANTIELVGACVIVKQVSKQIMLSDKTLRIKFEGIDPLYCLYYLRSHTGRNEIMERSTGNQESMRNIGQDRIRNIIIPVCPHPESEQINKEIQRQFSIIEQFEKTIDNNLSRATTLRQSILKKAFSGELVEQNPNDEPASVLLDRIRSEKNAQKPKQKKTKSKRKVAWNLKDKQIPQGWEICNLPNFTHIEMGQSPPSTTYNKEKIGLPFFQGKAEFTELYPEIEKYCSEPNKIAKVGATLLTVRAPVGPTNLANVECCIGRGLAAIHPLGKIDPKFILFLMRSIENEISNKGTGSTFTAINKTFLENLSFALPPTNEQKRIVAKIEELFSELDKGIENLKTDREQLKVYRQSLLKNTFEGKLTEKWREENQDKLKINKQVTKIKFIDLCEASQNGLSKRSGTEGEMIPVIRLADITDEEIDLKDLRKIKLNDKEFTKYSLIEDDLLCIRVNGSPNLVGRLILIRAKENLAYCDHFIRFRLKSNTLPKFIKYFFNTQNARRYIDLNKVSSAGQNTVSQKTIGNLEVPYFSVDEQKQISIEIETRFSIIDQIEEDIETNLKKSESLRQSILKKAFSGELVEQNPNDEPASVLLDRIRSEKDAQKPKQKKTKSKRKVA